MALAAVWPNGLATRAQTSQDAERARMTRLRGATGEALSPEEQANLDERIRAREIRRRMIGGGEITAEEKAFLDGYQAKKGPVPTPTESTGMIPLTELVTGTYKGEEGGLYGGGRNEPPPAHRTAVERELAKIVPLDREGRPSRDGKIVFTSIGMSNTSVEFSLFEDLAPADPRKAPHVVVVNGAQSGRSAPVWARTISGPDPWAVLNERLARAGVTPKQVQAVWIKHAQANPRQLGEFPEHARVLADNTAKTLQILRERYPNCRVAYLSSRIYAGYAMTVQSPEPYAYESAFAMRWVIQRQINGDPELNFDPAKGPVRAPAVVWGPYFWADGVKPRAGDGLVWLREDLRKEDGSHPSGPPALEIEKAKYGPSGPQPLAYAGNDSGRRKVARLLLEFVHNDRLASCWYLAASAK